MIYDLVVIGGGIAGLNTIYKYLKGLPKGKTIPKILLLEAQPRIGGRVYTVKKNNQTYESGAGRFSKLHTSLFELIKDFNLESKLFPIPSEKLFIPRNDPSKKVILKTQSEQAVKELERIIKEKKISEEYLTSRTLFQIAQELEKYSSPNIDILYQLNEMYPYYSEIHVMNAKDSLILLKRDFVNKLQYYVLGGGFEQIIDKIHENIKDKVKIKTNSRVIDILEHDNLNLFDIKVEKNKQTEKNTKQNIKQNIETYQARKVVFALTAHGLQELPFIKKQKELYSLVKLSSPQPLYRFYIKYTTPFLNKSIVTDSELKFIIPYNKEGLVMITYTDGPFTKYWRKLYLQSEEKVVKMITKKLKELLPNTEIPEVEWIDGESAYWTHGAHYWLPRKKYIDSNELENKIRNPSPNVWIIGEAFSNHQAWVEGALETSNKAVKELLT
jgi:monoamine oxidase